MTDRVVHLVRAAVERPCQHCPTLEHHQQTIRRAVDLMMVAGTVEAGVREWTHTPRHINLRALAALADTLLTQVITNPDLTEAWDCAPLGARRDLLTHTAATAARAGAHLAWRTNAPAGWLLHLAHEELTRTGTVALGGCPSDPPLGATAAQARAYLVLVGSTTRQALTTYAWLELANCTAGPCGCEPTRG